MEEAHDFSGATDLFDITQYATNPKYVGVGSGVSLDTGGATTEVFDFLQNNNVSEEDLSAWLAQNYPETLQSNQVNTFGQSADGGGIINSIINGWNALGNNGQLILGSASLGGLQNYMTNRRREEDWQRTGQMNEEQWQRQMLLRQAPTNKVANVDHFKGVVNSLRGGR